MKCFPTLLVFSFLFFQHSLNAQLYINEIMASNTSTIADENGSYEDWIEIYNASSTAIDLAGYYLSDNATNLTLSQIPSSDPEMTTIPPGAFLLLWADKDMEDGPLHLDFKLTADGEDLILTEPDGITSIDFVSFDAQNSNVSFGRSVDGDSEFQLFFNPSPGQSNETPFAAQTFSTEINKVVQNESDDAIQYGNSSGSVILDAFGMTLTESWSNQTIGIRFNEIFIPQGATVNEVFIQFTTKTPNDEDNISILQIHGELSPNSEAFAETNFNISDRPLTDAVVTWQPEEWTLLNFAGEAEKTINLAPLLQEIIDQPNWESGNSITFIISGEGERSAHNFTSGFPPTLEISVDIPTPTEARSNLFINEIASNGTNYQDELGNYSDWVEIYNDNDFDVNLGGLYLTDDLDDLTKWQIASIQNLPPNGFATIWPDGDPELGGFHASFKLDKDGETLALVQAIDNELLIIDSLTFGFTPFKASVGRISDAANDIKIFGAPTPLAPNEAALDWLAKPSISLDNGVFENPQTIELSHPDPEAVIRYTTDFSAPNENSAIYAEPLTISETQSIRAIAMKPDYAVSQIETKSYLFDPSETLPVLMVTTDPDNLYDDEIGIYTVGTNGTLQGFCSDTIPANFWQEDWERPANLTFFETSGEQAFSVNAGIKISGNCSRKYALKSLNIYLRSNQYGDSHIDYKLFPNRDFEKYQRLRLRNSGQDYRSTMMRDGVNQRILAEITDVEYQNFRPTLVYINGEYFGIQNFRDLYGKDYFEDHFGVDGKKIDILKRPRVDTEIKAGDDIHYNYLYDFMRDNDLTNASNFDYVTTQFDIENFLDYWVSMLYLSNADWPSNNVQLWRPRKNNGKWRYMYTDTDGTTNLYGATSPNGHTWDRISEVLDGTLEGWPNDNRSTLPFRRIMENQGFQDEFVQRSCTFIELIFNEDRVNNIINNAASEIDSEIGQHVMHWAFDNPFLTEYEEWAINVESYRTFFSERPTYFYDQLATNFGLGDTYDLTFNYDENTKGDVLVNWKEMSVPFNYSGAYFSGVPLRIKAVADSAYVFSHWLETGDTTAVIEFIANGDAVLTPIFEEAEIIDAVSEINAKEQLNISPNPANDYLMIEAPNLPNSPATIVIYNQLGQPEKTEQIIWPANNSYRINIGKLSDGFYFIELRNEDNDLRIEKFVIRK